MARTFQNAEGTVAQLFQPDYNLLPLLLLLPVV